MQQDARAPSIAAPVFSQPGEMAGIFLTETWEEAGGSGASTVRQVVHEGGVNGVKGGVAFASFNVQ